MIRLAGAGARPVLRDTHQERLRQLGHVAHAVLPNTAPLLLLWGYPCAGDLTGNAALRLLLPLLLVPLLLLLLLLLLPLPLLLLPP